MRGLFLEGRFNGGFFFATSFGGLYLEWLIHGGAYFWNFTVYTYNSSFICIVCIVVAPSTLNIIAYILHTIFHTSPVVLTVVTGRIWITIRPSSKDAKATTTTTVAKTSLQKKCIPAVSNFIALVLPR